MDSSNRFNPILHVVNPVFGFWASLQVECSWNESGSLFTCNTVRYRVKKNGRTKGNIFFGFSSAGTWGVSEISGNAEQDDAWHDISEGGTVAGNTRTATIYFEYIYDMQLFPDPSAKTELGITFSLVPPTIDNPRVVVTPRPKITGKGIPNALVKLYQHNVGSILFGSGNVKSDKTWEITLTEPLWMADPFTMTASQSVNGVPSGWAAPASFAVLFKPVISGVTVSADGRPTVNGTGGLRDATIEVYLYIGAGGVKLTGTVQPNGSWSATADAPWVPQTYMIYARQIGKVTGMPSGLGEPYTFTVKPPKPTITNPGVIRVPRPTISGTGGVNGALVKLYKHNVGSVVFGEDTVKSGDAWTVTLTQPLPMADPFTMTASQTLNNIPSDWADPVSFAVLFKLVISGITFYPDGRPIVRGTGGLQGATVDIRFQGGAGGTQLTTTVEAGGSWMAVAREPWPPNTYTITAKQIGSVTQQSSDWSDHETFTVKPPKPAITALPNPIPSNQALTITGVYSTIATLRMLTEAGANIPGTFTATSNTSIRVFSPTGGWRPGLQKVKVTQTVNSAESDPSDLATLRVKSPKPVITNPLVVWIPQPTISGTGVAGALVKLYRHNDSSLVLGSDTVDPDDNTWEITLEQPLRMADPFTMTASQSVNDIPSDWADLVSFAVLFKLVISEITVSADGRPTVRGTGVFEDATVAIRFQGGGETHLTATVEPNGDWRAIASEPWPPGTYTITAKQIGKVTEQSSDWADHKEFTVSAKPPKPVISALPELVPADQQLNITGVSGTGTVTLTMLTEAGATISGTFSPSTGTTRTFRRAVNWAAGTHRVKVVQTVDGMTSDPSDVAILRVQPPAPLLFNPPSPAPADQVLTIAGVYPETVTLTMLTEADATISGTFSPISENRYTFTPIPNWTPGTHKLKVVQTVDGVPSDPSALATFGVQPPKPAITVLPNPVLTNQQLNITGVYSGTGTVTLKMFTPAGDEISGSFNPSTGTTRTFTPEPDWEPGTQQVKVVQTVDGVASDPSDLATLKVRPPKPAITALPDPVLADQRLTITNVYSNVSILTVFTEAGDEIPGAFRVIGTTRTFKPTTNWAPGIQKVKVMQTVYGVDSEPSDLATLKVRPPKPAITVLPDPVPADQPLTITGVYSGTGTVTLKMFTPAGDEISGSFNPSTGTTRTFTPEPDWEPGTQQVKVVQTLDGVASEPSDLATLKVRPPKPAITAMPDPVPANQQLNITGVYSGTGTVTLTMFTQASDEIPGSFSPSTGATRTFAPETDWDRGTHRVKVVQTVDGVTSNPSDNCTFTVKTEDKPEAPQFELPLPGSKTSTRPRIKVIGQPHALMTVRREGAQTLHSDTASPEGVLEFVVETPLPPGPNALEAKQKSDAPESDWSEPHRFTVKEPPQTPVIDAPTPGSRNPRKPTIRGKGETRGQILLRHEDDPENLIDTLNGVTSWRWTAQTSWSVGHYTIQAQQADDGDDSSWTEPRTFEVVDARYGVGDAGPVLAQPVLSNNESVLLRVQVVSGVTGKAAEGVTVEWRIAGEQAALATTVTSADGWARYLYTPGTAGEHTVLADLTNENQGVVITQQFEVTALADDAWAQALELYLDGEKVDLAEGDIALLDGKSYELRLEVNSARPLTAASVTLEDLSQAEALGLAFTPPLGTPQPLVEGQSVHWSITCNTGKSGYFGLKLTSSILPDWHLPGRVIAQDLSEDVEVHLDTFAQVFGGDPAYPCLGATHTLTVRPNTRSLLLGEDVMLELTDETVDLGVIVSPAPDLPQPLGADGVSWSLNCTDSTDSGRFAVRLKVREWDFRSLELPMSLGHNKVEITERFGPTEMGGSASYWMYGIRATSTFTGQPAGGVPVTVTVSEKPPTQGRTAQTGWIYVNYYDDESASLIIRNLYDNSWG
ncbi:alpha-2-macroglobulin family protein [Pseudomonas ogarae]|uniref:Coniferyl-alcohol dehydrogenase n=1 Tax=Pseudomonas ogarae (strain DSM 112162 / CECT 30235 / F113) TaxID=1114970 RepID=A0ABM6R0N1_PSEO1|nr:hypothetical protein [Pseudomonas ogarae]AEV62475.1 cable pili-associated 22 kda adhesin protein [Pseudomonas ogarae]AUO46382.1 coniferyl-alcohol dehydrogenase [Pseudomonas ogarae]